MFFFPGSILSKIPAHQKYIFKLISLSQKEKKNESRMKKFQMTKIWKNQTKLSIIPVPSSRICICASSLSMCSAVPSTLNSVTIFGGGGS